MKILLFAAIFIYIESLASACDPTETRVSGSRAPQNICSGDLLFEDNFDTLDQTKWGHDNTMAGGGNNEFQWYVNDRANSYTAGGILHLKPTFTAEIYGEGFLTTGRVLIPPDQCTDTNNRGCDRTGAPGNIIPPIRSALVRTRNIFSFRYGVLEIRAKLPAGDWIWPALWMMPQYAVYGGWPRSGEIDLVESKGNPALYNGATNVGNQQAGATMHFGPVWDRNGWSTAHNSVNQIPPWSSDFHTYRLVWNSEQLQYYYDDVRILTVTAGTGFWIRGGFGSSGYENPWAEGTLMAPFDQEFYIIMNVAIGGTNGYWSDSQDNRNGPKPWANSNYNGATSTFWNARSTWEPTWNRHNDDSHMQVDYVRVWAL